MEIAVTVFLVGLFSGVHCVAMCGGVLGALNLRPQQRVIAIRDGTAAFTGGSLTGGSFAAALTLQLAYNFGRISSYALAGAIAGGLSGAAVASSGAHGIQFALGIGANALLVLLGLHLAGVVSTVRHLERLGQPVWKRLMPLGRRLLPVETPKQAVAVGALWGWLPCGLVYSALGTAFMAGGAMKGAMVMAAFGLGTLPNLVAAGFALERLRPMLAKRSVRVAAGSLIVALGLWGLLRLPAMHGWLEAGWLCLQ